MSTNQATPQEALGVVPEKIEYRSWLCVICGLIYNERDGVPAEGIAPGTRWEDVPDDWICDDCGAGKSDFELIDA